MGDKAKPSQSAPTREDLTAILGDADPTIISRILSSGASNEDLRLAQDWLETGGDAVPSDEPTRERVRALAEMIATARTLSGR